jgi:hypothetical protein
MKTYGGMEYNFAILDLGARWRGQLHATTALSRGKEPHVPITFKTMETKNPKKNDNGTYHLKVFRT